MRFLFRLFTVGLILGLLGFSIALVGSFWVFYTYGRGLPEYRSLAAYQPPVVTRLYAADGRLLAEYANEKRIFVPIESIPPTLIRAFLSAEDKNFYNHFGVDPLSVARAALDNVRNVQEGKRLVGASTITQQVAKNFLLTNEVSLRRKIREAILSFRLERALSKDRILELYLNEIYLGRGSYGVAAAALDYFGKSLNDLTLAESAYLAALPKAPNNYHPVRNREAARERRNWVLRRMAEDGHITSALAATAMRGGILLSPRGVSDVASAAYFAEEVRRELATRYGESALYGGGLAVRTTLNPRLQEIAERALRAGLLAHDQRRGWRAPFLRGVRDVQWKSLRERHAGGELELPPGAEGWHLARVVSRGFGAEGILQLETASGEQGRVAAEDWTWAATGGARSGPQAGDVVFAEVDTARASMYFLRQIPLAEGGLVALDPHSGRVLAMVGGFSQRASEFNRATQALRQTGSAFKPFVYLAALESGLSPTTSILDAPFVADQGPGLAKWKPRNYRSDRFYGATPLRVGVEKSRNLMTVRLASRIGMAKIADTTARFGLFSALPPYLSYALGAGEVSLIRLTAAYGQLANGGRRIEPFFVEKIQDRHGKTLHRVDTRACPRCAEATWDGAAPPVLEETRVVVTDPASAYQMVSILEGVVKRGTGRGVRDLGHPLAGKTGTTNDFFDAWFVGFSSDLVVGTYVGYDRPRSLGNKETGARTALPIWRAFMKEALANTTATPFRVPPEVRLRWVFSESGAVAESGDEGAILEAFKPGQRPVAARSGPRETSPGTGGLY